MFKENDYLVYRKDVCRVKEIRKNNENGIDYYILAPIDDDSLIIEVPTDNRARLIRNVISKEEAEKLISIIPKIEVLSNIDDKYIESTYKDLISNGAHEDLVKIIKTSYLRNEERKNNKKKTSKRDSKYFKQAERYLYNELSISLGKNYKETKEYVINVVKDLIK